MRTSTLWLVLLLAGRLAAQGLPLERAPLPDPHREPVSVTWGDLGNLPGASEREVDRQPARFWAVPTVLTVREEQIGPHRVPRGTRVHYTPTGRVRDALLPVNTVLQGLPVRGDGHSWMTAFHPEGGLATAWLARVTVIDGLPCTRATTLGGLLGRNDRVTLHPDGRLASCRLARDTVYRGQRLRKGQRVFLDAEGRLLP
jgi:hypothetical protein